MVLIIDNQRINNIEELIKSIRERHEDYGFIKKLNDLFVDGELEEYIRTCDCKDANRYIELLRTIDKGIRSDSVLFRKIADVFELSTDPIRLDLRENFEYIGLQWEKYGDNNDFIIREEYYPEVKEQDIYVGLKVKSPVMESVNLSMKIKDYSHGEIRTLQSDSCMLNINKNSVAKIRFHANSSDFEQYRIVELYYNDIRIHSFATYPSRIGIRVKNIWFSMHAWCGERYEACVPFLLWFVLMPKTTYRDERYVFYDIKLEEMLFSSYDKDRMVNQCIYRLRNHTGLNITLKTEIPEAELEIAKWCGTTDHFYNPNDEQSSIYINLSLEDYKQALKDGNDCFVMPDSRMGIFENGTPITNPQEIALRVRRMLNEQ